MKFLLLHPQPYLLSFGGLCVAQRAMMEGLARLGHECVVVTTDIDAPQHSAEPAEDREDVHILRREGVTVLVLRAYEHARSVARMAALVDREQSALQADFVLVAEDFVNGSPPMLGSWLEAARQVIPPSRLVYLAHSGCAVPFGPESFDVAGEGAHRVPIFQEIAGIITVSQYMQRYLEEQTGREVEAIPFPAYGAGPFRRVSRFGEGVVGMINPSEIKGLPIFLGLARRMRDVQFAAVPTWATSPEERRQLEAEPNVQVLAPVADRDTLFGQLSVLLVPSLWQEAWGMVVVEAMLRGVPVMASKVGGVVEAKLGVDYVLPVAAIESYDRSGRDIPRAILPAQDLAPWESVLRRLLEDPDDYERVARASQEAAQGFVESLGIPRFERYFERLLAASPQPRDRAPGDQQYGTS